MSEPPVATPLPDEEVESLVLSVAGPLTATFDALSGILRVESMIPCGVSEPRVVRLQLEFSAEAALGFVRLLRAVEHQLGVAIADRAQPPRPH